MTTANQVNMILTTYPYLSIAWDDDLTITPRAWNTGITGFNQSSAPATWSIRNQGNTLIDMFVDITDLTGDWANGAVPASNQYAIAVDIDYAAPFFADSNLSSQVQIVNAMPVNATNTFATQFFSPLVPSLSIPPQMYQITITAQYD